MNLLKYYQKLDDAISYLFSSVSNEKKLLKDNLKKREIIYVDIGTNVGNYLEFIKKNFKTRQVFCFEPIESLFKELNLKYIILPYLIPKKKKFLIFMKFHLNQVFIYKTILINPYKK